MARPRTFDEHDVVGRARQVFHDHGYAATSVEQLTAATGLQRSSLYGAFGDKHGVFLRAFDQYVEETMGGVEAELAGDEAGALRRLRRHMRAKAGGDPAASQRGCLLARTTAELGEDDPEVARLAADAYRTYERALTGCVRAAQAAGDLRADLDAAALGAMLLATLRGIESLGRAGRPPRELRRIADTALAALAPLP
jgi:TetR/AcrR family transcriptional regulator, transcriptional repressor for nem operon